MRLTLRTLLAYLDDRLSPANAREIGQKIAKSPFATELEERIKSVVRRRRLAKESVDQKTIDPNLIAEYLDDQLTPELVALIEKEILSSDASLAEVAATHQILGLLSDPVDLSQTLKDRLYKLAPGQASESGQVAAQVVQTGNPENEWKPLAARPSTPTRSPMLLLGAMVLGWLGLLATDAHLFQSPSLSQTQADPADPELAALDAADGKPAKVNPNDMALNQSNDDLRNDLNNGMPGEAVAAITDGSEAAVEPLGTGKPAVSSIDTSDVSPPEIGSAETVASIDSPPMKTDTSSPTDSADASTSGTDSESTDPVDVTPAKTVAAQSARIDLVDQYGMVVLEDRDNGKWMWAVTPEFSSLNISDKRLSKCYAAIAEPFDARLNSPEQGWSALVPGSSMFETVANEQSGVRLLSGRLIVEHVAAAADPIRFKLFAGSQSVDIELPTARSYAAIRLVPGNVESSEADAPEYNVFPEPRNSALTIYAVGGDVMVNIDAQTETLKIARGSHLVLSVDSGDAPVLHDMPVAPNWVFDAVQPKAESTMSLIKLTASEFRKSLTVADAGTEVMENLNPEIAAYGVKLPALLRNVDDLASALLDSQLTTVRTEAIHGLQAVNRQNVGGRTRIIESLQTRLPEAELDNVMKLIGGISQTAAEDRATSSWLVSMLNNNRPAVRELAIFNLENLTGERNNFIVDDDSNRRDIAVRRWTKLLERNDGRLVSPPN